MQSHRQESSISSSTSKSKALSVSHCLDSTVWTRRISPAGSRASEPQSEWRCPCSRKRGRKGYLCIPRDCTDCTLCDQCNLNPQLKTKRVKGMRCLWIGVLLKDPPEWNVISSNCETNLCDKACDSKSLRSLLLLVFSQTKCERRSNFSPDKVRTTNLARLYVLAPTIWAFENGGTIWTNGDPQ